MELLKKKSGFEDAFFVIIVLFTIAIFLLILHKAWVSTRAPMETAINSALPNSSVNVTKTFNSVTGTIKLASNLLPFILIGLFMFVFIGTAIYFNHPIMIFVGIIILGIAILLGVVYSNIYHQISASDTFSSSNSELQLQEQFMKFLPFIVLLIFVAITGAIIYLRQGAGGGGL
mgnify:CR=1 FL=1